VKVLSRRTRWLTAAALAVVCIAGTVVAHDLPAARARAERTARADQWRAAAAAMRERHAAILRQQHVLRSRYNALVRRAHQREGRLVHGLAIARRAQVRRWRRVG
jgi:hypothetical protein